MKISGNDLRILILYTLHATGSGIPVESLCGIVSEEEIGNLNVMECFSGLLEEGLIRVIEDEGTSHALTTPEGEMIVEELKGTLSVSLRKDIEARAAREVARLRTELAVTAEYRKAAPPQEGYYVSLGIRDCGDPLCTIELFAPTAVQAELMLKNFKADPNGVYTDLILKLMSGELQ